MLACWREAANGHCGVGLANTDEHRKLRERVGNVPHCCECTVAADSQEHVLGVVVAPNKEGEIRLHHG